MVGTQPCLIQLAIRVAIECLDAERRVIERVDSATQRALFLSTCRERGLVLQGWATPAAVAADEGAGA